MDENAGGRRSSGNGNFDQSDERGRTKFIEAMERRGVSPTSPSRRHNEFRSHALGKEYQTQLPKPASRIHLKDCDSRDALLGMVQVESSEDIRLEEEGPGAAESKEKKASAAKISPIASRHLSERRSDLSLLRTDASKRSDSDFQNPQVSQGVAAGHNDSILKVTVMEKPPGLVESSVTPMIGSFDDEHVEVDLDSVPNETDGSLHISDDEDAALRVGKKSRPDQIKTRGGGFKSPLLGTSKGVNGKRKPISSRAPVGAATSPPQMQYIELPIVSLTSMARKNREKHAGNHGKNDEADDIKKTSLFPLNMSPEVEQRVTDIAVGPLLSPANSPRTGKYPFGLIHGQDSCWHPPGGSAIGQSTSKELPRWGVMDSTSEFLMPAFESVIDKYSPLSPSGVLEPKLYAALRTGLSIGGPSTALAEDVSLVHSESQPAPPTTMESDLVRHVRPEPRQTLFGTPIGMRQKNAKFSNLEPSTSPREMKFAVPLQRPETAHQRTSEVEQQLRSRPKSASPAVRLSSGTAAGRQVVKKTKAQEILAIYSHIR